MRIEVDQSIKIEDAGASVWALANGEEFAITMSSKVKRRALEIIRSASKSQSRKVAKLKLFALGVFLLVEDFLPAIEEIVIDREYEGQKSEAVIKGIVYELVRKGRPDFPKTAIRFGKVAEGSRADRVAYAVHKRQRRADKTMTLEDIYRVLALEKK